MMLPRFSYLCLSLLAVSLFLIPVSKLSVLTMPSVMAQTPFDRQANANNLLQQGIQFYNSSRFREAIQSFENSLTLYRQIQDRLGEAHVFGYLGNTYYALGHYSEAIKYHQQQLNIAQKEFTFFADNLNILGIDKSSYLNTLLQKEIHQKEIDALNNLGNDYLSLGQSEQAKAFYQQSLEISQKIDDSYAEAFSISNLAKVYVFVGQIKQSVALYQQSLAIFQKIKHSHGETIALSGLGNAYQALGDYPQTIQYYQQSLAIQKKIGDFRGEIQSLVNLGNAYLSRQHYQAALEAYHQSLVISRKIDAAEGTQSARSSERLALNNIGLLLTQQNQPDLAILFYKQSILITQSIRQDIQGLPEILEKSYTETVADTYYHLAELLEQDHRTLEAQQIIDLLSVQRHSTRGTQESIVINTQEQKIWTNYNDLLNQAVALNQELTQLEKILQRDRTPTQEARIHELLISQAQLSQKSLNLLQ